MILTFLLHIHTHVQMYSSKSFAFSMEEIVGKWGDVSGKDLFFTGSLYDFYYLELLTGTGVSHVFKDGVQLKLLGCEIRTFKPGVPFSIQVVPDALNNSPAYTCVFIKWREI